MLAWAAVTELTADRSPQLARQRRWALSQLIAVAAADRLGGPGTLPSAVPPVALARTAAALPAEALLSPTVLATYLFAAAAGDLRERTAARHRGPEPVASSRARRAALRALGELLRAPGLVPSLPRTAVNPIGSLSWVTEALGLLIAPGASRQPNAAASRGAALAVAMELLRAPAVELATQLVDARGRWQGPPLTGDRAPAMDAWLTHRATLTRGLEGGRDHLFVTVRANHANTRPDHARPAGVPLQVRGIARAWRAHVLAVNLDGQPVARGLAALPATMHPYLAALRARPTEQAPAVDPTAL